MSNIWERKWFEYLVCKEIKKWTACSESYSIRWRAGSWLKVTSALGMAFFPWSMLFLHTVGLILSFPTGNQSKSHMDCGSHISPSPNGRWFTHQPGEGSLNIHFKHILVAKCLLVHRVISQVSQGHPVPWHTQILT